MTIEQAIDDLMDASRTIAEVAESESDEANRINAQNVADDCKQLAAWLRELQDRRKAPEIVRCGECKWYGRANKQRFYRGMDCLQRRISTIVPDKDFCSRAERKCGEKHDD